MAKLVSKIYGDALFETAMEEGRLDEFFVQVEAVKDILIKQKELFRLMDEPKIDREEKMEILKAVFGGRIAEELIGLLLILVEKGRFRETIHVLDYFLFRVKEQKGIGLARVVSAIELSDVQKEKVEKGLLETTKYRTFEIDYEVDPALIGGIRIRIGDRIVDGSIRTKLERLSSMLRNISMATVEEKQKRGEME